MILAPTLALATTNGGNGDDDNGNGDILKKAKVCQVKVQVKVYNAVNQTIYLAELDDLPSQAKQANFNQSEIDSGDDNLAFMFQYKKGGDACPAKGGTEYGKINNQAFAVVINSITKVNKIGIELDPMPTIQPLPGPDPGPTN